MKIAVIGWGSLIWSPGNLALSSRWYDDGPYLPLEFARKSDDGRLTLVIHGDDKQSRTYWAESSLHDIDAACTNLKEREGTKLKHVQRVARADPDPDDDAVPGRKAIWEWLGRQEHDIEAAVWTALPPWEEFTLDVALAYLRELERNRDEAAAALRPAREYIRNAPAQTQTPLRERVRKELKWEDAVLSEVLFAR